MLGTSKVLLKKVPFADDVSDPVIMQQTVRKCTEHNIAVAMRSGLPDIQRFRQESK